MIQVKPWIHSIDRTGVVPRDPSKIEWLRLDKSERITKLPEDFYSSFIQDLTQEDFICYPNSWELKTELAKYNGVTSDQVYLSAGSDQIIKALFECCIRPGDEVLTTAPSFPMYKVYGDMFNANTIYQEYNEDLSLPIADMTAKIDLKTKLVVLANPNNPIGDYHTEVELIPLIERAAEFQIPVLIDEAYYEYAPGNCINLIKNYNNVCISRTFSKALGGAGIRLGYLLGSVELVKLVNKVRMMYDSNAISIKFGLHVIQNIDIVNQYTQQTIVERNKAVVLLQENGFDVLNSHANWIHLNNSQDNNDTVSVLDSCKVLYKSNARIPFDNRNNWIRLTVGPGITEHIFFKTLINK